MQSMYVRHMLEYCHVLLDVPDLTDNLQTLNAVSVSDRAEPDHQLPVAR